jgi:ABC-type multidrug transport system permease subunit
MNVWQICLIDADIILMISAMATTYLVCGVILIVVKWIHFWITIAKFSLRIHALATLHGNGMQNLHGNERSIY